jgi:hypothetical protein
VTGDKYVVEDDRRRATRQIAEAKEAAEANLTAIRPMRDDDDDDD